MSLEIRDRQENRSFGVQTFSRVHCILNIGKHRQEGPRAWRVKVKYREKKGEDEERNVGTGGLAARDGGLGSANRRKEK